MPDRTERVVRSGYCCNFLVSVHRLIFKLIERGLRRALNLSNAPFSERSKKALDGFRFGPDDRSGCVRKFWHQERVKKE